MFRALAVGGRDATVPDDKHHTAKVRLPWRILLSVIVAAGIALVGVVGWYTLAVHEQASIDESRPADVIVVLGAAEYRGTPSPVLKARLDHGLELYRKRLAGHILTTGGAGGDPDYTEGGVGRDYLIKHGVPADAILVERDGESTVQSMLAAAEIMRHAQLKSCIVVSDGYHVFRSKRLLEDQGIIAYGSPRPGLPMERLEYWRLCVRQAVGYLLWNVGVSV